MAMKSIAAEGVWCPNCEVFEVEDISAIGCLACGCARSIHQVAEVVVEDGEA